MKADIVYEAQDPSPGGLQRMGWKIVTEAGEVVQEGRGTGADPSDAYTTAMRIAERKLEKLGYTRANLDGSVPSTDDLEDSDYALLGATAEPVSQVRNDQPYKPGYGPYPPGSMQKVESFTEEELVLLVQSLELLNAHLGERYRTEPWPPVAAAIASVQGQVGELYIKITRPRGNH